YPPTFVLSRVALIRPLHSFPTRRSSDLTLKIPGRICGFQDHCCKRQKDPYHYSVDGPQKKDSGSGGHENKKFLPAYFEQPYSKVDRKSTRLNSSHVSISYAVFCLKKKTI